MNFLVIFQISIIVALLPILYTHFFYKKQRTILFTLFILITYIGLISGLYQLYGGEQIDETVYRIVVSNFSVTNLNTNVDTKPIFFLIIEKILNADIVKTRILNIILIAVITSLLYNLTKNTKSLLFILIPISLLSMWLTVEIFEILFLLLAFTYPNKSGYFVGFATIFRPYSLLFFLLLDRKQKTNFTIIFSIAIGVLLYSGLFFPYIVRLLRYGIIERTFHLLAIEPLIFLIFLVIGFSNIKILNDKSKLCYWQIISFVPFYIGLYGHYFLTPVSLLFLGYLLQDNKSSFLNFQKSLYTCNDIEDSMVVTLNTGLPKIVFDAIEDGTKQEKWHSSYHFLQQAAIEKLQREGLINFDAIIFIHYFCAKCNRHIYVLPEIAALKEWHYCSKCYPNSTTKENALIRNGTSLGKEIPKDAEIRRC